MFPRRYFPGRYYAPRYYPRGESTGLLTPLAAGIVAAFRADATIAALVGPRIRPGYLPQQSKQPAITYAIPSDRRPGDLSGPTRQRIARVLFTCQAPTEAGAEAVARAIDNLIDGLTTDMGGCRLASANQQDETDGYTIRGDASEKGTFVRVVSYRFDYRLQQ